MQPYTESVLNVHLLGGDLITAQTYIESQLSPAIKEGLKIAPGESRLSIEPPNPDAIAAAVAAIALLYEVYKHRRDQKNVSPEKKPATNAEALKAIEETVYKRCARTVTVAVNHGLKADVQIKVKTEDVVSIRVTRTFK